MKMRPTCLTWIRATACAAVALAMAAAAAATTIERMSLAKMAVASPVIVRARCEGSSVRWDGGEIWTVTSFNVQEAWRGSPPARIRVWLLGGSMGDLTSRVSGVPRFQPGENVVLFLEPMPRGNFSVVSWQQGTFRIRRDASGTHELVTQDTAAFATFDPVTRQFRAAGIRNMDLGRFRAKVKAALQRAGSTPR